MNFPVGAPDRPGDDPSGERFFSETSRFRNTAATSACDPRRTTPHGGTRGSKPVWINDREIFLLPWGSGWDALQAAPEADFWDVWGGRASLCDAFGSPISPNAVLRYGERLQVRKIRPKIIRKEAS